MKWGVLVLVAAGVAACSRGGPPPAPVPGEMEQGVQDFHAGRWDEAVEHYRKALAEEKNAGRLQQAQLWNLIGMAYRFQYNAVPRPELKEQEIAAFKKALEYEPDFVVALVNLGASYYFAGRKREAAPVFRRVLELTPQHPEAEQLKKMAAEGAEPAQAGGGL